MSDYLCECVGDDHKLQGTDKEYSMLYAVREYLLEGENYRFLDTVIMNKNCKKFNGKHEIEASTKHLNLVHYTSK